MIDQTTSTRVTGFINPGVLNDLVHDARDVLNAALTVEPTVHPSDPNATASNVIDLEAPSTSVSASDIALRIGMLQEALNELMTATSKLEIDGRMKQLDSENKRQLERFEEMLKKAAEALKKQEEGQKKGNIFEAASNWIQAAVSIASGILSIMSGLAQMAVNPVGGAAMMVAGAALIGAGAVQLTLAIDATMEAAGQQGFLSDKDKARMKKAVEILGYIALAASMIGLMGSAMVALNQVGKTMAAQAGKEATRYGTAKMVATGAAEAASKSAAQTASRTAYEAFKTSMDKLTKFAGQMAIIEALGSAATQTVEGVGRLEVAEIEKKASDLQAESDKADAAAKEVAAQIAKLQAIVEQLQQELGEMMEQAEETLAIIYGAIEQSANSMTKIQHTTGA